MKEMLMWDKYDNKYRNVVDVECVRQLEADLYEANNRINDLLDIVKQKDKIINEMVTWINVHEDPFENCHENSISCADISCEECIKKYFEERCK